MTVESSIDALKEWVEFADANPNQVDQPFTDHLRTVLTFFERWNGRILENSSEGD